MRTNMEHSLKTILAVEHNWPSRQDLLHDTGASTAIKNSGTRPFDALPFHLDRVTDTEHSVKTKEGMQNALARIWNEWKPATPIPVPEGRHSYYETVCTALLVALAGISLTEEEEAAYTRRLAALERDAVRQTATGLSYAGIACPSCSRGELGRPYTSQGLLDLLACDTCEQHHTLTELNTLGKAYAKYGAVNANVTIKEASDLLDVQLKTLHARMVRGNVKHVGWKNGRKTYPLAKLR